EGAEALSFWARQRFAQTFRLLGACRSVSYEVLPTALLASQTDWRRNRRAGKPLTWWHRHSCLCEPDHGFLLFPRWAVRNCFTSANDAACFTRKRSCSGASSGGMSASVANRVIIRLSTSCFFLASTVRLSQASRPSLSNGSNANGGIRSKRIALPYSAT